MQSSEEIIRQFVLCKINKSKDKIKEVTTLLNVTAEIENDYRSILNDGIRKCSTFDHLTIIMKEMEKDMNWGRLITVYTFAGVIAEIHKENEEMTEKLINWLSCSNNIWINNNGGWKEFMKRYKQYQPSTNYYLYLLIPCIYCIGKLLMKFE